MPESKKTRELLIRFASSYGGTNPGASEIQIFSVTPPKSSLLGEFKAEPLELEIFDIVSAPETIYKEDNSQSVKKNSIKQENPVSDAPLNQNQFLGTSGGGAVSPVAYWRFEESTNGVHQGNDDDYYIDSYNFNSFTIECMAKANSYGWQGILVKDGEPSWNNNGWVDPSFVLKFRNDAIDNRKIQVAFWDKNTNFVECFSSFNYTTGKWYQIAVEYDDSLGELSFYIKKEGDSDYKLQETKWKTFALVIKIIFIQSIQEIVIIYQPGGMEQDQ